MSAPLRFADIEALLVDALSTVARVVTRLPAANLLTDALPVIRVQRFGGGDDRLTDTARVDLDTFAATYDAASALARTAHTRILGLAHTAVSGTVIDTVETIAGPIWVTYENQHLQRFVGTYEITVRVLS